MPGGIVPTGGIKQLGEATKAACEAGTVWCHVGGAALILLGLGFAAVIVWLGSRIVQDWLQERSAKRSKEAAGPPPDYQA